jgi:hypothetical protein
MGEDGRAVAFDMLIEPDAGTGIGHDRCERGLADLKRIAPQVVAVQFDEVEGVEEFLVVSALVPDDIERGEPMLARIKALKPLSYLRGRQRAAISVSDSRKPSIKSLEEERVSS